MKTLEQFKEAYANILDTESKDAENLVNLTIEAGKLRLIIQSMEMGITKESLISQLYKLK